MACSTVPSKLPKYWVMLVVGLGVEGLLVGFGVLDGEAVGLSVLCGVIGVLGVLLGCLGKDAKMETRITIMMAIAIRLFAFLLNRQRFCLKKVSLGLAFGEAFGETNLTPSRERVFL